MTVRVLVLIKATADSEEGVMPSTELIEAMGKYSGELAEAVEWVKHSPNPMPGPSQIEIRPVFEMEDFGEEFTRDLREQEERLREEMEGR